MPNASNSDARKRAAERVGYQSGYCGRCGRTDPTPEPTAASSIDAETLDKWEREAEVVIARRRTTYTGPEMSHRIVVLITALRDEQQAREKAEARNRTLAALVGEFDAEPAERAPGNILWHFREVLDNPDAYDEGHALTELRERTKRAEATLAAVRAWAANPYGAKSELRKILGDES